MTAHNDPDLKPSTPTTTGSTALPQYDASSPATPGQPLLTLRVSRDSGQTWGTKKVILSIDDLPPLLSSAWSLCQCPQCGTHK